MCSFLTLAMCCSFLCSTYLTMLWVNVQCRINTIKLKMYFIRFDKCSISKWHMSPIKEIFLGTNCLVTDFQKKPAKIYALFSNLSWIHSLFFPWETAEHCKKTHLQCHSQPNLETILSQVHIWTSYLSTFIYKYWLYNIHWASLLWMLKFHL